MDKLSPLGHVVETSFLYTTSPQYVTNQPSFLNAVVAFETNLEIIPLLEVTYKTVSKYVVKSFYRL